MHFASCVEIMPVKVPFALRHGIRSAANSAPNIGEETHMRGLAEKGGTMVASRSVDISARGPSAVFGKDCNPPENCINCIRASALGAELTDEQLHTLRDVVEVHMLSKGEILISEGECNDHLYAIASGELEICRASDRGREISLQRLGPGSRALRPRPAPT